MSSLHFQCPKFYSIENLQHWGFCRKPPTQNKGGFFPPSFLSRWLSSILTASHVHNLNYRLHFCVRVALMERGNTSHHSLIGPIIIRTAGFRFLEVYHSNRMCAKKWQVLDTHINMQTNTDACRSSHILTTSFKLQGCYDTFLRKNEKKGKKTDPSLTFRKEETPLSLVAVVAKTLRRASEDQALEHHE